MCKCKLYQYGKTFYFIYLWDDDDEKGTALWLIFSYLFSCLSTVRIRKDNQHIDACNACVILSVNRRNKCFEIQKYLASTLRITKSVNTHRVHCNIEIITISILELTDLLLLSILFKGYDYISC